MGLYLVLFQRLFQAPELLYQGDEKSQRFARARAGIYSNVLVACKEWDRCLLDWSCSLKAQRVQDCEGSW